MSLWRTIVRVKQIKFWVMLSLSIWPYYGANSWSTIWCAIFIILQNEKILHLNLQIFHLNNFWQLFCWPLLLWLQWCNVADASLGAELHCVDEINIRVSRRDPRCYGACTHLPSPVSPLMLSAGRTQLSKESAVGRKWVASASPAQCRPFILIIALALPNAIVHLVPLMRRLWGLISKIYFSVWFKIIGKENGLFYGKQIEMDRWKGSATKVLLKAPEMECICENWCQREGGEMYQGELYAKASKGAFKCKCDRVYLVEVLEPVNWCSDGGVAVARWAIGPLLMGREQTNHASCIMKHTTAWSWPGLVLPNKAYY